MLRGAASSTLFPCTTLARSIHGDPIGLVEMRGSELAGPQDVAARVVLDDEGVIRKAPVRSPVRLSGEGAICAPGHIRAGGIHGDGNCLVLTRGSELAGPQDVAARVVLAEEGVA